MAKSPSDNLNPIGTWELTSFEIEKPDKGKRPWGKNLRGLLIYSATGHVTVSIQRDVVRTGNPDKDLLGALLFYAGTFTIEGNTVLHKVTIASSPARVGKEIVRYAALQGDTLTLKAPPEPFGTATLTWRRV